MRSLVLLAVLLLGCGTRTALSVDSDDATAPPLSDAGRTDAGPVRRDAGRRDAGRRDAGTDAGWDAGPPRDACRSDAQCAVGVCRGRADDPPRDLAALSLFCGAPEADPTGAPGSPCQERTTCDRHLCTVSGTCVIPCSTDADCEPTHLCREAWVRTSEDSMESLRACTARFAVPSSVRVVEPEPGPDLGSVAVLNTIPRLRPNGLVIWMGPSDGEPLIERIIARESGEVVFDAFEPRLPGDPAPVWGVGATTVQEVATLMVPNGPNTPRSRGGYDVFLSGTVPGPSERSLLRRRDNGTVFDIDAYLVGGGGWRSPRGEIPAQLARGLADLRELLRPIGLSLGDVRVHEVVGGLRRRFEVLEGEAGLLGAPRDLPPLYRLSAGGNRPSVNIFFVRMIEGALGIASGVPGPHGMNGTGASGVAISVDFLPDTSILGMVLAHEIGHFMGLFHTSELDGTFSEPLTDTAECGPDRDADLDGFLLPDECIDAGADNVMFWAGEGRALSPQQADLMRRAYFVR